MRDAAPTAAAGESSFDQLGRPLSQEDLSILALESETVAGHACKVIVLGERIDPDHLRSAIASRLDRAPALCMCLHEVDGKPWWTPQPEPDLQAHVVALESSEPPAVDALAELVARVFEQRLDRSRPLWCVDVVPRLAGGGSALIWRIHHALADGETSVRLAQAVLWDEPEDGGSGASTPPAPRAPQREPPGTNQRLEALLAAARETPQPWLRSPFNGHIAARRSVAFATVELEALRRSAHAVDGATVNDAVLALVAGGLRRWLEYRHGHIGTVRVKVPVSLHQFAPITDASAEPGNRDSFFCLDLPLGSADPVDRLRAIRRATRIRKRSHDAQQLDALMAQLARSPRLRRFAERALAHPRSFALAISNIRGPQRPVQVLGAPVLRLYPVAEIREHHALRIAAASYTDTLSFGLSADPTLVPELDRMANLLEVEAGALVAQLRPGFRR